MTTYDQARAIVIKEKRCGPQQLQRALKISYNEAIEIINQLESDGIVGPFEGNKVREVLK